MNKIIGVTELQRRFRAVFDEVAHKHVPYVLTRGSRPEVVMLPYEMYARLVETDETSVLARFDKISARLALANAAYPDEEIESDLRKATKTIRKRK